MGLGLVGIGMGLGLFSALTVLLAGGGWLWAVVAYALAGAAGVLAGGGAMLWHDSAQTRQTPGVGPVPDPASDPQR